MILFRLLTWPYVRKHKLRTALTLAGIAIGVAVLVGMRTANQNVTGAFRETVDRIAGNAQLEISAGETGFPEDVLEKVQSVPEVQAAAPVLEAVVDTGIEGQGSLMVLGVDMTGDRSLRQYDLEGGSEEVIDDPLVFLAQPDSLILSEGFARRNGIASGNKIRLQTMQGPKQFTVRGIMRAGGLASAFGGNIAVMDIYAAQLVFGRSRFFDRIDIRVRDDATAVEQCQAKLASLLGDGFQVERPSSRAAHFESLSRALSISINFTSIFALLIGVFIIYNSFAIAITQRRAEIGVVRALGATPGQVSRLFLAESALGGVLGSLVGIGMGLLIARGIAPALSSMVTTVYAAPQQTGPLSVDSRLLFLALALGVVVSMLGGILPARSAANLDPVKALQKGQLQTLTPGADRFRWIAGLAAGFGATGFFWRGYSSLTLYVGYVLVILALLLFSPAFSYWLALALRPLWKWLRPVEGSLASESLIQAPRRTSATVAGLMLSLAMAVGFAGVTHSFYTVVTSWIDTLSPDLYVASSPTLSARAYRFPAAVGHELSALPEVEEVQPVRNARMVIQGSTALGVALDVTALSRRMALKTVEGRRDSMFRECAAGRGVILSDSLANLRNLHVGDVIGLGTPRGALSLPVLGTIVDFSDPQGSFLLDQSLYRKYWQDDTANLLRVYLKKGVNQETVKESILAKLGGNRTIFVFTNAGVRQYVLDVTAQWFGLTYVQLAVALLVAALGIVNTLTVSITDRRRELGVVQAVGGLQWQVRLTIWLEAVAIGLIGLLLGLAMGAVALYYNLGIIRHDTGGIRLDYQFPFGFALLLLPVIVGVAFLASLWPAEAAVRGRLVESLEYE